MVNFILAISTFIILIFLLFGSAVLGRFFGKRYVKKNPTHQLESIGVAEGSVFALLGLLIAFSFTGAYERFEARKLHIIDEANAASTTYLRFGLFAEPYQSQLRDLFKQYMDARLAAYEHLLDFNESTIDLNHSKALEKEIWQQTLIASKATNNVAATQLVITSLNNAFDIATLRYAITRIHPPVAIFVLLIGLAMLGGFLAGYSTAINQRLNYIHIMSYVLITAFVIYLIIDVELPRLGLINVDSFDSILIDARNRMD